MSSMSKVENHECCCLWVWLTIKHVKTLVLRATLDHSPIIVHRGTGTALRSRPENAILDRNTGRFRSCSVKMHHKCRSSFRKLRLLSPILLFGERHMLNLWFGLSMISIGIWQGWTAAVVDNGLAGAPDATTNS